MSQMPLVLIPGQVCRHVYSGEVVCVAESQEPIRNIEYMDGPEVVYVRRSWGARFPMFRFTLEVIE